MKNKQIDKKKIKYEKAATITFERKLLKNLFFIFETKNKISKKNIERLKTSQHC